MRSHARLTYTEVWDWIANGSTNPLKPQIDTLYKLYQVLLKKRHQRGAIGQHRGGHSAVGIPGVTRLEDLLRQLLGHARNGQQHCWVYWRWLYLAFQPTKKAGLPFVMAT